MNLFDSTLYTEVRKPLDEASGLPPACYFDEDFYQRELETIFHTGWVMVGRGDRLPEPGSYFTAVVSQTRLILTRDDEG
jgi:choline monooxygenase